MSSTLKRSPVGSSDSSSLPTSAATEGQPSMLHICMWRNRAEKKGAFSGVAGSMRQSPLAGLKACRGRRRGEGSDMKINGREGDWVMKVRSREEC